jgi:putative membrane protein
MMRAVLLALALMTLAAVWLGPLPQLAPRSFTAHMTMHIGVVAVSAPLLAFALAGGRWDPSRRFPPLFSAIPASVFELIVVSAWHAPALHHAARESLLWLVVEQLSFLVTGFLVWMSAAGGGPRGMSRSGTGVVALLLTSMHMTLLGSLIALTPRPLYGHAVAASRWSATTAAPARLDDQHRGGVIMLLVGGASYLAGGLWLSARLLDRRAAPIVRRTRPPRRLSC